MSTEYAELIQKAGELLDLMGVAVIFGGVVLSTVVAALTIFKKNGIHHVYRSYRHNLARSILIGLEFLVAGDIIRSVAGVLDFSSVIILAIIVLIRSLLGVEFEMEIDGRWPWKRADSRKK